MDILLNKIQDLFEQHPKLKKIELDNKVRKVIEHRFMIKRLEPKLKCHQAHVCLIFEKKQCVSVGINNKRQHAEVDALRKILYQKDSNQRYRYGMVTFRFSKTGVLNNSSPCIHCSRFLSKYLDLFHSICFSEQGEKLRVLTHDMFRHHCFCHISKGNQTRKKK